MKYFAFIATLLILLTGVALGQNDPFGAIDTLSIAKVSAGVGDEVTVDINLWNDQELGALTLPFHYPQDKLIFQEVIYTGGRVDYITTKPVLVNEVNGTILIGIVVVMEEYIPVGDGRVCTLRFRVRDDVAPGEILTIDTTFIPPAGTLLLSDATGVNNYPPIFEPGTITITAENRPPYFTPVPELYVAEGDSLYINVEVTDPEGDDVVVVNPIHPYNSKFTDNGDGTGRFAWRPDFVGPLSSDMGPFYFVFWTSDGEASSYLRVKVNVINVNRAPIISAPETIETEAGDSLAIHVAVFDPDFEDVEWEISGLPSGASFDYDNPGLISWNSDFADSGHYQITLTAYDPFGMADTAIIEIELLPVTLFSLRIDTLTSFSGRIVDIDVMLKNKFAVSEFNVLLRLDPSVLSLVEARNEATRSAGFNHFIYYVNENSVAGALRVVGRADGAEPIGEGEGVLFRFTVRISSDLNFVGQQIPMDFYSLFSADNTLRLDDNTVVTRNEINLFDGYLLISANGERTLGDINLNSVAYEISDAVYFSNFFISPTIYPLNEQQLLNSDVNRDGFAPSVADLVLLIKIITGECPPPVAKPLAVAGRAEMELVRDETGLSLRLDSPMDVGGAWFRLSGADVAELAPVNLTGLDMMQREVRGVLSGLLISYEQEKIPAGEAMVVKLSDDPDLDVRLDDADVADVWGRKIDIDQVQNSVLPTSFELLQNYPNPFNPTTDIRFNMDKAAWVTLTVYNILGQEVMTLADRDFPAGQHSIVWNGTDRHGETVASGVYLYRIKAGDNTASKKMVLLK